MNIVILNSDFNQLTILNIMVSSKLISKEDPPHYLSL